LYFLGHSYDTNDGIIESGFIGKPLFFGREDAFEDDIFGDHLGTRLYKMDTDLIDGRYRELWLRQIALLTREEQRE
jgi:hypothetical protein